MRVIAGEAKGRRLVAPAGLAVRPTADRVRQSIFDMLAFRWEGGRVLDLFAGSGALGIEALSRGAEFAVFAEKNPAALKAVDANVQACRFADRAEVRRGDFRSALRASAARGERFSLVFIDPPYEAGVYGAAFEGVREVLAPGALIVVETGATEPPVAPPPEWETVADRKFGRTLIHLYRYVDNRDLPR